MPPEPSPTILPHRSSRAWIPYFILAVSLIVTGVAVLTAWEFAKTQEEARFENAVQSTEDTIHDRIDTYTLLLRGTGGLFDAKLGAQPQEFYNYAHALKLSENFPGTGGIGWSIRVTSEQVPELEKSMRQYVRQDFHVWPMEPKRGEYFPIVYLDPQTPANIRALGYDMHSDVARAEAMDRARDTGEAAASSIVTLVQSGDGPPQRGFLYYMPVYRGAGLPGTVAKRRELLAGFVYTPFKTDDLLSSVFGSETQPRVDFAVYDYVGTEEQADRTLVFRSNSNDAVGHKPRFTTRAYASVGGRTWMIEFASRRALETTLPGRSIPWLAITGTLISLLLFGLSRAQTAAREASERTAEALRKRELALAVSETRFRSLFAQSPVTIQLFAPDGTTLDVNDAWEKLWQAPRSVTVGYNLLTDPALQDDPGLNAMRRAFEGELVELPPKYFDPEAFGKIGRGRWVESFVYPIKDADGAVSEVVLMHVDVTERMQAERAVQLSEERYRSLVDATAQIVWTTSATGDVVEDLPTWRAFTGQRVEEIMGRGWLNALHPDDRERVIAVWTESLESKSTHEQEFRVRRHDGQWRDIIARSIPVLEGDGELREWVGTCTDITDRKRAETERDGLFTSERDARQDAERANRLKDEFLATMSHELRTPLNAILGWAQLLRISGDEEDFDAGLETIERNAKSQARLVDDLLDISRIIAGKLRLDSGPVDVKAVMHAAIESVHPLVDEKSIRLSLDLPPHEVATHGDPSRLQQIVWNLISNAVKFTPAGGDIAVSLRTEKDAEPPAVVITVMDSGCGIPADFLPYVFDRFRQADASTTRRFGGLGLGLGIVRHLVELHHGTVHAESDGEGCGARFVIRLPLITPEIARLEDRQPASTVTPSRPNDDRLVRDALTGLKILVIDDDADLVELMKNVLALQGAAVVSATSSEHGVQMFKSESPDLVLSDIGMPGEDGYRFIRDARHWESEQSPPRHTPIIALTGMVRTEDTARALEEGFDLHISKPIENRKLVEAITNAVASRKRSVQQT